MISFLWLFFSQIFFLVYKLGITRKITSELRIRKWWLKEREEICSIYLFQILYRMEDGEIALFLRIKAQSKSYDGQKATFPLFVKPESEITSKC